MPLVQIHLMKGNGNKYVQAICDGVHTALCAAWKIPKNDRFQIVTEHKKKHFYIDPTIWGVKRSDNVVVIYITSVQRTAALKKKLYAELAKTLSKNPEVRIEDIFVTIVSVKKEDWSFGKGIAQFLTPGQKP